MNKSKNIAKLRYVRQTVESIGIQKSISRAYSQTEFGGFRFSNNSRRTTDFITEVVDEPKKFVPSALTTRELRRREMRKFLLGLIEMQRV